MKVTFSLRLIIYSAYTRDSYFSSVFIVFLCQCNSVGMYAVSDSGKQLVLAERGIWLAHICEWQLESFCARCLCSSVTLPILSLLQYVNECRHSCSQPWEAREFSCCLCTPRTAAMAKGKKARVTSSGDKLTMKHPEPVFTKVTPQVRQCDAHLIFLH